MKKSFLFFSFSVMCLIGFSQDTIVLKANVIVGDTVDATEKARFGLFGSIDNASFDYAVYLGVKTNTILKVKFKSGEIQYFPYTVDGILQDSQRISDRNNSSSLTGEKAGKKMRLKVVNQSNHKSHTFKEGDIIYYTTEPEKTDLQKTIEVESRFNKNRLLKAKIIEILDEGDPSIIVEAVDRNTPSIVDKVFDVRKFKKTIPISDLTEVSYVEDANYNKSKIYRLKKDSHIMIYRR